MRENELEPNMYDPEMSAETEIKPEVLYRAFTVDPNGLTSEIADKPLVPGKPSEADPTKISDGNELGVYMSTNRSMTERAYEHSAIKGLVLKSPKYNDRGLVCDFIQLPHCGLIVEVNTENLPIRRPEISAPLQGHYNNGWEGDEWIADVVPPEKYKIVRLILNTPGKSDRLMVDVEGDKKEDLEKAIEKIKEEFDRKVGEAHEYKDFLESLDNNTRLSEFRLKRKWEQFLKTKEEKEKKDK